jgi:hypothetical protein
MAVDEVGLGNTRKVAKSRKGHGSWMACQKEVKVNDRVAKRTRVGLDFLACRDFL